jgi:hypothetical protein
MMAAVCYQELPLLVADDHHNCKIARKLMYSEETPDDGQKDCLKYVWW